MKYTIMKNEKKIALGLLSITLVGLFLEMGCNKDKTAPSKNIKQTQTKKVIKIKDMAFHPDNLTIQIGDTVVFINKDNVQHNATEDNNKWHSSNLKKGETWRHVFTGKATFNYYCSIHPHMKGTIIIE